MANGEYVIIWEEGFVSWLFYLQKILQRRYKSLPSLWKSQAHAYPTAPGNKINIFDPLNANTIYLSFRKYSTFSCFHEFDS